MDAELTALAAAGATALVQQMVTESWAQARDRVARFFARGSGDEEALAGELEEARIEVVAARGAEDEATAADVQAEWRSRLRRRLAADPEAAAELRALLEELSPEPDARAPRVTITNNTISGGTLYGTSIQAGTIGTQNINGNTP